MGRIVARQRAREPKFYSGAHHEQSKSTEVASFRSRDQLGRKQAGSQSGSKDLNGRRPEGGAVFGELRHARDRGHDGNVGANDDSATRAGRVAASACSDHRSRSAAPRQHGALPARADRAGQRRRSQAARRPEAPRPRRRPFAESQDARTGTVGVYANSTSIATKTNTPLVNIPQSVTVVTKDFIRDQSFQSLTDVTRYVPGVAIHQGEGNRDELVIRGVDFQRQFLRQRFSRRRPVFPRPLQRAERRNPERTERADLRPRRRRRSGQPHAQGSRRHAGL